MSTCRVRRCGRPVVAHDLCATHEARRRAGASLRPAVRAQRAYSTRERAAAVDLVERVGARQASRELEIPRDTLRTWARKTR